MDEVVQEFLIESHENLDQLDQDLVALESDPANRDLLASVFRTFHTIKGTAGFLGYEKLEALAHVAENLLARLRDGELVLTPAIATALLSAVDAVREMLASIEASEGGSEGEGDYTAVAGALEAVQSPAGEDAAAGHGEAAGTPPPGNGNGDPGDAEAPVRFGEILVGEGKATPEQVDEALARQQQGDPRHVGEILVEQHAVEPTDVVDTLRSQSGPSDTAASSVSESTIRVDVGLLDGLMNLVSELVLARNQILQLSGSQDDSVFLSTSQRLNHITTELQEGVMKTRMQPIGNLWSKFPRVVRDLSVTCGKQVRVEMEGEDTELDRTILEAIKDPLTHLVRNVVDHGIESPNERERAGKRPEGRLLMRAFHEGGQVNIEIKDDGKGIDIDRVRDKAVASGIVTAEQARIMNDREALNLIFLPGFSTAAQVTNVSGRGVGMDVVRTNIEKIGGTVDVTSRPGSGTTFWIKIPLTLAIIPALMVSCDGNRYAIPQVSLLELVRLEGEDAATRVEVIHGAPVYRLRGRLLPLVELRRQLDVDRDADERSDSLNIVVLQADDRQFGLVVDEIGDTEEIVVKPLSKLLKHLPVFAGATIMGDGQVALILDVVGLSQQAGLVSETAGGRGTTEDAASEEDARRTLLVIRAGGDRRMAVPLDAVTRLEEFDVVSIERAGGREVVQYRSGLLPLVRVTAVVGGGPGALSFDGEERHAESLHVVVHEEGGRAVGFVVDEIIDIVEETIVVDPVSRGPGILGAAVVQGIVTDLVDVADVLAHSELESALVGAGTEA